MLFSSKIMIPNIFSVVNFLKQPRLAQNISTISLAKKYNFLPLNPVKNSLSTPFIRFYAVKNKRKKPISKPARVTDAVVLEGKEIEVKPNFPKVEVELDNNEYLYGVTEELLNLADKEVVKLFSTDFATGRQKTQLLIEKVVKPFKRHEQDVGSPEVQIAKLTVKIKVLITHLASNRKNFQAKRAIQQHLHDRRSLLLYLKRTNPIRYVQILQELGIRPVRPIPKYNFGYGRTTP